jgi:hypothetical protein
VGAAGGGVVAIDVLPSDGLVPGRTDGDGEPCVLVVGPAVEQPDNRTTVRTAASLVAIFIRL